MGLKSVSSWFKFDALSDWSMEPMEFDREARGPALLHGRVLFRG